MAHDPVAHANKIRGSQGRFETQTNAPADISLNPRTKTHTFGDAMRESSIALRKATERQRALRLIGLCEIIAERAPQAEHLVVKLDERWKPDVRIEAIDAHGDKIEGLFGETEQDLQYSGVHFKTTESVSKVALFVENDKGHFLHIPIKDLAGKIPANVHPEDFLEEEYELETAANQRLNEINPLGPHSAVYTLDNQMNVTAWRDWSCDGKDGTAAENPELASAYSTVFATMANSTRTSWKWTKDENGNGWDFTPAAIIPS